MNEIINLITEDASYNVILLVCVLSFLGYLWKHYEKVLKTYLKQNDKNADILDSIKDIVKNSEFIEKTLTENVEDLNSKIKDLELRINNLEKIVIESNTIDKEILKDIETVRKSIEMLQIVKSLYKKFND